MDKLYTKQFLGYEIGSPSFEKARVIILPFPYEGGVSYGKGAEGAPDAILEASPFLELFDEVLSVEPSQIGIATVSPPDIPKEPEKMFEAVYHTTQTLIQENKFVILLGGDHSVSSGYFKALHEKYKSLSAIQIDAHADLRQSYEGSQFSHACVMSKILEYTSNTLQIGIRSMCTEEAKRIKEQNLMVCTMHQFRSNKFDIDMALERIPDPVFLTIDVDAFDLSVVSSTGTPEPGGFLWDEGLSLLNKIFTKKNVIGFDVVELSYSPFDKNSPYAVAKLIYKLIGYKFFGKLIS